MSNNTDKNLKHINICIFSSTSDKYGSEISLLELIDSLKNSGASFCVVLPSKGALYYELKKRNIKIIIYPIKNWARKKTFFLKSILRLIYNILICIPLIIHLKYLNYNLIYSNTILVFCGAFVSAVLQIPHIWHIHEFGFEDHQLKFDFGEKLSCKIMSLLSQKFICVSKAVATKYSTLLDKSKITTIYQSVSLIPEQKTIHLKEHNTFSLDSCRLIYMAQLTEGKRPFDAIKAVYLLRKLNIDVNLTILGNGPSNFVKKLKKQCIKLNISNSIKFIGYTDYFFSYLKTSDICIVCSKKEGFGRAAIYAMKAGIPVIATNSGGSPEIVKSGVNGLLYPPGDILSLTKCILRLIYNKDLSQKMGMSGKEWVDNTFTQVSYGKELEKIFINISRKVI